MRMKRQDELNKLAAPDSGRGETCQVSLIPARNNSPLPLFFKGARKESRGDMVSPLIPIGILANRIQRIAQFLIEGWPGVNPLGRDYDL